MTNKCDLSHLSSATKVDPHQEEAETLGLSPERLQEIKDYAIKLRRKFPQFKEDRLRRKVAEYFKIKLT